MRRILYRQQVASLALCMPHALSPSRFPSLLLSLSLSVSLLGIFNFNARSLLSLCHLFSVPASSPPLPPSLPALLNVFWHALAMRLCVLPSFPQPCLTSPFSLSCSHSCYRLHSFACGCRFLLLQICCSSNGNLLLTTAAAAMQTRMCSHAHTRTHMQGHTYTQETKKWQQHRQHRQQFAG